MFNKKLVVLDFLTNEVTVYNWDENTDNPETFEDEDGNLILHSNTQWMIVEDLKIIIK